jgi:uncharacterized membrane protein
MQIKRAFTHLLTPDWRLRRHFPETDLQRIAQAVRAAEQGHDGQICVALEAALPFSQALSGRPPRHRALDVFAELKVWDTERNNGVLIYVLLADHDVEIIADRGIHARTGPEAWEAICRTMEQGFRAGTFAQGVIDGINGVAAQLAVHFPRQGRLANELSDRPTIL